MTAMSLRQLLATEQPRSATPAELARARNVQAPYSLAQLESRHIGINVGAPAGIPVGGNVGVTMYGTGDTSFSGSMTNTGVPSYSFSLHALWRGDTAIVAFYKSGILAGEIEAGTDTLDWDDRRPNPLIAQQWHHIRDAELTVTCDVEIDGIVKSILELGKDLLVYVAASSVVAAPVAALIAFGPELSELLDAPPLKPPFTKGILVGGGMLALCGPGILIPAVVVGLAVDDFDMREMYADEIALAKTVFGDVLDYSRVRICNASHPRPGWRADRAFFTPMPDGYGLISAGPNWQQMMSDNDRKRTLIHELVHYWQATYERGVEEMWQSMLNIILNDEDVYSLEPFDPANPTPWEDLHTEAQASAVAGWWFECTIAGKALDSPWALRHRYYRYVAEHVRFAR